MEAPHRRASHRFGSRQHLLRSLRRDRSRQRTRTQRQAMGWSVGLARLDINHRRSSTWANNFIRVMLEVILSVIGALGGWEAIKYLINRKSNQRTAVAEADLVQFHTLQETLQFLQTQLKEKEERFAEQTTVVRKLNLDIIDLLKDKGAMEVELVMVRCNDADCPFRQPPNAKTPPKEGLTKEQYQAKKQEQQNEDPH